MSDFKTSELRDTSHELQELSEQLAASQLREQQLREVLNTAADKFHDYAEIHSMKERTRDNIEKIERNLELARMCDAAIALPSDTTALEALIAKAGEVMRERSMNACSDRSIGTDPDDFDAWDHCNYSCAEAIRTLPGVTLDDLKGGAA